MNFKRYTALTLIGMAAYAATDAGAATIGTKIIDGCEYVIHQNQNWISKVDGECRPWASGRGDAATSAPAGGPSDPDTGAPTGGQSGDADHGRHDDNGRGHDNDRGRGHDDHGRGKGRGHDND